MKVYPECYNCFITQAIRSSRIHTDDNKKVLEVVQNVVKILTDIDHQLPPPVISENVYKTIRTVLGVSDPYKEIKKKYNHIAMDYEKFARVRIKASKDPVFCALKLSLAGNIIDFGGEMDKFSVEETINDTIHNGFFKNDTELFKADLKNAENLILIADNTGEIVFDKILIETIKNLHPKLKIHVFVRGGAIINDALFEDAVYIGLDKIAKIVSAPRAIPGFWPEYCNAECRKIWEKADIIISKGQGNFETLSEINDRRIYFLLIVKCKVVASFLKLKKFSKIFMRNIF